MKNLLAKSVFIIICIFFFISCTNNKKESNVKLVNTYISPKTFSLTNSNELMVKIKIDDPQKKVRFIEFSFLDIPGAPVVQLNDNGKNGDVKEGDSLWCSYIPIPPKHVRKKLMQLGTFTGVLKLYDFNKEPLKVNDSNKILDVVYIEVTFID